ncbi:MAG: hypothetical protein ACK5N9_04990 [Pirellula sp.]
MACLAERMEVWMGILKVFAKKTLRLNSCFLKADYAGVSGRDGVLGVHGFVRPVFSVCQRVAPPDINVSNVSG